MEKIGKKYKIKSDSWTSMTVRTKTNLGVIVVIGQYIVFLSCPRQWVVLSVFHSVLHKDGQIG